MMHDTVAAIHIMPTCGMHRVPIQRIFLLLSVAMTPTFNHTKEYPLHVCSYSNNAWTARGQGWLPREFECEYF